MSESYIDNILNKFGVSFKHEKVGDEYANMDKLFISTNDEPFNEQIKEFLEKMGYSFNEFFIDNGELWDVFTNYKVNEEKVAKIICEALEKKDVKDIIEKDKDVEKRVRKIANEVITDLFRVLWQHNGLFKNLTKN